MRKMIDLVSLYKEVLNNQINSSARLNKIRFVPHVRLPMRSARKRPLFIPQSLSKLYTYT